MLRSRAVISYGYNLVSKQQGHKRLFKDKLKPMLSPSMSHIDMLTWLGKATE